MKRTLMVVAMLAALTIPMIASADDQGGCHPSGILHRPHGPRSILYDWSS